MSLQSGDLFCRIGVLPVSIFQFISFDVQLHVAVLANRDVKFALGHIS
jgi:hypothetical protein